MIGPSAYLVQEEHYFMETVQLKGLNYTSDLQDDSSAFSLVLSAIIKSKVGRPGTPQGQGRGQLSG